VQVKIIKEDHVASRQKLVQDIHTAHMII